MNERWILVGDGTTQTMYVGKTDLDDADLSRIAKDGAFLSLSEARVLRTLLIPNPTGGIIMRDQMTPTCLCRGSTTIYVKPTSYFWPSGDTLTALLEQVKDCAESEVRHRVHESGLVTPDCIRVGRPQ